jgi:transposase
VALTFASADDDPLRFKSSKTVGVHFGLMLKKVSVAEIDCPDRISKVGDADVRTALLEAVKVISTHPVKVSALRKWGMGVAKRAGMK